MMVRYSITVEGVNCGLMVGRWYEFAPEMS